MSDYLPAQVEEDVRGVVNGVQDSINNSLDLVKCVLVILLPAEETFGLLIIASFVSISFGWLMYALYSRSQRGHLFHFRRLAASLVCLPEEGGDKRGGGGEPGEQERMVQRGDQVVRDIERRLEST